MKSKIPILLLVVLLVACSPQKPLEISLNGTWEMVRWGEDTFYPAEVPGVVHLDLLNNGLIEDPFYGDNEEKLQWIGEATWLYSKTFLVSGNILENEHVEIIFEGLDTYAQVSLNGMKIIEADNMFRRWARDVKELLREGENTIEVMFLPPGVINEERASKLPFPLPDNRVFTRKSPYQFGWDWGPVFITSGIWKDVYLKAWSGVKITGVHVYYSSVDDDPIPLDISVTVNSEQERPGRLRIFNDENGEMIGSEKVSLKAGENTYLVQLMLEDPKLWWPAGLGKQKMYHLRIELKSGGSMDETETRFGIREVRLIREPDAEGETFYFEVNGLPVFMKGANYVPQDNFLTRVDSTRYEELFASVLDANMNMLRVWGGGFYENDIFYNLCDEHGILVWQDFMFACAMYPGDNTFLENVKNEAVDNVSRLSNHPCIALWCGNNEIDEGWHNWGWQKQFGYSDEDSSRIWHDYLRIFHDILPAVVEQYDPGTVYRPSSPMTGWGREAAYTKGDVHYWGVWWGEEPFSKYRKKVGRFVSEYGFQGMPSLETIQSFGGIIQDPGSGIQHPDYSILEAHQKHPRGTGLIAKYMARDYKVPDDFEDYVYVSQVMQAEGMGQAFYTHRISQPYCMGTLYWQLNDCWPVTSWSGIDFYGRRKALHYHVKRAYAPLMIRTFQDVNGLHVFAVNDHAEGKDLALNCVLADFNGDTLLAERLEISLPPQSNQRVYYLQDIPAAANDKVLMANLVLQDSVIGRSFHYFVPPKSMDLSNPGLNYAIFENGNGPLIRISVKNLARQVFLEARGAKGYFSDNFFDMAAGETRWIRYSGSLNKDQLEDIFKIKTLYETY